MLNTKIKRPVLFSRRILVAAALVTAAQLGTDIYAGTTGSEVTISTSGSTALKNWFIGGTFTDVEPNTTLSIGGVSYPPAPSGFSSGLEYWTSNNSSGHPGSLYQLAPKTNAVVSGTIVDQTPAIRLEYHESGSVEGILELANDQIAPVNYITQNVNRDPGKISGGKGGNNVFVSYNQFGSNGNAWSPSTGATANGHFLGNFYNQSGYTSANPNVFVLGGNAQPTFNISGGNPYSGQNAVQIALSDAVPVQVFAHDNISTLSSAPWTLTPQNPGYGQGNIKLVSANLGTANTRQIYQSTAALNMSAGAINPRTGAAFVNGPWNNGELNNLSSVTIASTATLFVANPGTGLTQLNRGQAQFLETTGRLANGALFNMSTRDVYSGTRNVSALETGIDPTWAVGNNDNGNGNLDSGASAQIFVGPGFRFSNKTAGGAELRPTVQASRMAVGTLSINDANGNAANSKANPLRALAYSDSVDGSAPYVAANLFTISGINTTTDAFFNSSGPASSFAGANPTGQQYTIFQNEQAVALKSPDASYNNSGTAFSSTGPKIQGDDSYGDVKALVGNTLGSVKAAFNGSGSTTVQASPITGLMSNGYIPPQLMAMGKAQNGLSNVSASGISSNPAYSPGIFNSSQGLSAIGNLAGKLTNDPAANVTTGTSSFYGGSSQYGTGPSFNTGVGSNSIAINSTNYLFGNFNQTGVRDYDAVIVQAQKVQAALEMQAGNNAYNVSGQSVNSTLVTTGVSTLDAANPTKGDLIALGDYNSDGKFDGKDLYYMATGASLTSSGSYRPTESGSAFTTGTMNATGSTFSTSIASSVLNKNVALDYLQANATSFQKVAAAAILTGTTSNASTGVPAGATLTGTDAISGNVKFTYDPNGLNAFAKGDVNQDGVIDFNDALAVDSLSGKDYTSLNDSLSSYIPAPVTGTNQLANLVLMTQSDVNPDGSPHTKIDSSDLTAVNTSLTSGAGNASTNYVTNWYGFGSTKTGLGTISWNRSSSVVNVYSGASLQVSSGTIQVVTSGTDPFTDNNQNLPGSLIDTSKSLAVTVTAGGTLRYINTGSLHVNRLSSLNVSGGTVKVDASTNDSVLVVGGLSISGALGKVDLGNSDIIVRGGNLAAISDLAKTGYANGAWTGNGITSSSAAGDSTHLMAIGVIQNTVDGTPTGTALYSTAAGSLGLFDGVLAPAAADVLVKLTYYGDTNLDGTVDGSDYTRIDSAFNAERATPGLQISGWANGDFNYDGVVNGSDYTLLDNAFNTQGAVSTASIAAQIAGSSGSSAVPEPASLGLFGLGVGSLLSRRRRA